MLSDELKTTIQRHYSQLLKGLQLQSRLGQKQMIAEIANALGSIEVDAEGQRQGEHAGVCVIEAGTGTGKTLAYLSAALPVAQALNKKLVIATATVALQEQVIHKDLPAFLRHAELEASFALAKGRGRYLCLSRLDNLLRSNSSQDALQDLFGIELDDPAQPDTALYERMLEALADEHWNGERDDWPESLEDRQWQLIAVDQHQCSGRRCSHFSNCYFFKSREALDHADCIVANHDLVLADLNLGGGVILPAPEDSIYVFDEGHHLPVKGTSHFSHNIRVRATGRWLEQVQSALSRLANTLGAEHVLLSATEAGIAASQEARSALLDLRDSLDPLQSQADSQGARSSQQQYIFDGGVVPASLRESLDNVRLNFTLLAGHLDTLLEAVKKSMDSDNGRLERDEAERWYPLLGSMLSRAQVAEALCRYFARQDPEGLAPYARWLTWYEGEVQEVALSCSPVLAADTLSDTLWSQAFGVVLTSATLRALGSFDFLAMRSGLPENTRYASIASPFDHSQAGVLQVPDTGFDPSRAQEHTEAIVSVLPSLTEGEKGVLVLFSSRRQMQDVLWGLQATFKERILCQDDYGKQQLLRLHRERIDAGEPSIIFGLASLAEGIDLPGDYCSHVIIAKIPFPVPNDPVDATLGRWVESQGRNAFQVLSMPEAAMRLIQASGRLLRSEKDNGTITILDQRLVTKPYGRKLIGSLPPYRRQTLSPPPR